MWKVIAVVRVCVENVKLIISKLKAPISMLADAPRQGIVLYSTDTVYKEVSTGLIR